MTTKKCPKCQENKLESEFYQKNKKRKQSYCKSCHNDYCQNRWKKRKIEVIDLMGGRCQDCGVSFPPCCYDFHHLDPTQKDFEWTKMRLKSLAKIKAEL